MSLVVYYKIIYLFLAVTILEDWDIYSVNMKTAYLYDDLNKEIVREFVSPTTKSHNDFASY